MPEPPEPVRACLDRIEHDPATGRLTLSGWMLDTEEELSSLSIWIDGERAGGAERVAYPGVAAFFPSVAHAEGTGFVGSIELGAGEVDGVLDVAVVGESPSGRRGRLDTWFRADASRRLPLPPAELMQRTVHNPNPSHYLAIAMQSFREFWERITRHAEPEAIERMLDWGCGCGRLTAPFLEYSGIAQISGCDIDAEGVAWCREHLPRGRFATIPPYPPTAYPDAAFDLIVSYSVFTHLSRENQELWLREMERLLAPGGIFVATVHGDFAVRTSELPGDIVGRFRREGIFDGFQDATLDGIAPEGYYRATFQSRRFTEESFSRVFDVVAYSEGGALNFQDMVVMKKGQAPG